MRPYLYLRRWWRRTSSGNRGMTSVAMAVAVALCAWIFVPTGGSDTTADSVTVGAGAGDGVEGDAVTTAPGDAATADATDGTTAGGSAAAGGATATTAPPAGGGVAQGGEPKAADCAAAPSGTPGVTDKTITVAAIVLNLAGPIGNGSQGLASPDEFKRMAQAVANDINASGGVQCRKLELKFYEANPLNNDQQRSVCLQVVQDRPFLSVDLAGFAYPPSIAGCLPQQKVPFLAVNSLTPTDLQRFHPYIATANGNTVLAVRDAVLALNERSFFDPAKGFKKLGVVADECTPEAIRAFEAALAEIRVPKDKISMFAFPCPPGGFAAPSELSQAVLQHRRDGATHVVPLTGSGSFNTYTNLAQGQDFRPTYGITDHGNIVTTQQGNQKANPENFNDNNVAITVTRSGAASPGVKQDPATLRCQSILVKAGFPPGHAFVPGGGIVCMQLWLAQAAINGARALTREQALPGLFNAGTIRLPYPQADVTFRAPNKLHGGDTWWPLQYQGGCECWRILDLNRRPTFPR